MNNNRNEHSDHQNQQGNITRSENKGLRQVPLDEQGQAVLNQMNFKSTAEQDVKQNKKIFDELEQAVSNQYLYDAAVAFDAGLVPAVNRGIQSGKDRLANHMKSRLAEVSEFVGQESSKHIDHMYENYASQSEEPNAWAEIEEATSVFDLIEGGDEKSYGLGDNASSSSYTPNNNYVSQEVEDEEDYSI